MAYRSNIDELSSILIQLLIEKTSFGYKKCKELYSTKVSVLSVKYLLVILHHLPTDGLSQLAISVVQYQWSNISGPIYRNVVQYTGMWSNIADYTAMNPVVDIYKASETLIFKPSSFIV